MRNCYIYKLKDFDFVICGHVHNEWSYKVVHNIDKSNYGIMINVGCDVWKYKPVRLDEVIGYYNQIQGKIIEENLKLKK